MPTIFASELEIERIGKGLLDRTLPKREWTHAGHFAAVLWLLRHRGEPTVSVEMPHFIRAYNEHTGVVNGDSSGYHETITLASIRAAWAVLATHDGNAPLNEVANALLASDLGRSEWLLRYWSKPRLFGPEARKRWLDPDLEPFPY
jgi:hypothetical protein